MKRLALVMATAVSALAACDDRPPEPVEPPVPPVAEAPPPVETPPEDTFGAQPAPTYPTDTLPPEQRESAETVQPESETLFY